jgi:hypothetical protein
MSEWIGKKEILCNLARNYIYVQNKVISEGEKLKKSLYNKKVLPYF